MRETLPHPPNPRPMPGPPEAPASGATRGPTAADEALIDGLSRGDRAAWLDARRRLLPRVVGWCRRTAAGQLDNVAIEDLADDIFYDFALDCAQRVASPRGMWGYLKIASIRRTRRLLARRGRHRSFEADCIDRPAAQPPDHHDGEADAHLAVDRHRLAECLDQLTARARRVLELRFCNDLKDTEIGRLLDVSSQYTGRIRKQALASLRTCMEGPHDP